MRRFRETFEVRGSATHYGAAGGNGGPGRASCCGATLRWGPWLSALAVAVALSCGGGAPGPTQAVVNNTVQVTVSDGPNAGEAPAGIDMGDKRMKIAFEAIDKLLGHPVQFEVDNSLIPKFESRLHEAFIEALETLVTSLQYAAAHYPAATAFAGPHLGTIAWTYSPSKGEIATKLDVAQNRLDVPVPADAWRLLPDSMIVTVFDQAWDTEKDRRYAAVEPAAVPLDEHKYYYDYLRSYHPAPPGETKVDQQKRAIHVLRRQIALYDLAKEEAVRDDLRRSLVNGGTHLRDWYADLEEMPELAKSLHPVHAAWIKWLNASFTQLSDTEQRDIGRLLFSYSYKASPGFPAGLDVVKLGTPRIRSWLARSKEPGRNGIDAEDGTNSFVVCPFEFDKDYHQLRAENQSCNGIVYTTLVAKGFQPLLQLLRTEKAPTLTHTVTLNILDKLGSEAAANLIDALWGDPEHVRAALFALAAYNGWGQDGRRRDELPPLTPQPLLARIPGWWRAHPELHPELLYLTVTLGDEYEGTVVWPRLSGFLGARLAASDVAGFLQQTPRAIWYLRLFVHSLSDGWSRSKMMIPELERFLNDASIARRGEPQPFYVAERCVQFLCITGNAQDISALQKYLKDRIERFPSEARSLSSFADESARQCPEAKAAAVREAKASKQGITFGD